MDGLSAEDLETVGWVEQFQRLLPLQRGGIRFPTPLSLDIPGCPPVWEVAPNAS